ncbi:MAG: carbohydrate-binding protein [Lachnospiraceae bacterium]|nr:carbohydrate-binding protein [Lachnospiraceae bacterium]
MGFLKVTKKNSIFGKACSIALSIAMVAGLTTGYIPMAKATEPVEVQAATTPQYRNVMYYGEWSIYAGQHNFFPSYIDGSKLTHLNFAFMDVDENGNVICCDEWADFQNPNVGYTTSSGSPWAGVVPALILLRNQYPNMKIGFSVGGWTRSGDFPKVAASATARKNFAQNIAKAAHLYGYDFVDIDWEYPTADRDPDPTGNGVTVDKGCKGSAADTHNFTLLLQELRNALNYYDQIDNKHYELSVAMSASPAMMAKIEYDQVLKTVDFANMMTYDLCGAWAPYTGHQTALFTNEKYDHENQKDCQFSVDACVRYLYDTYGNSIDASKIVVGVAPYTRGWAGVQNNGRDSSNPGLYATAEPNSVKAADGTTSGTFAYSDIGTLISQYGLQEYYDETAQACYYYSPSRGYFFTCDNARSVRAKGEYVKNGQFKNPFNKPLGGLISWMASLDAANEITNASYDALYGNTALPAQSIKWPTMDGLSATVSTSGNNYVITVKNNSAVTTPLKQGTFHGGAESNILNYAETFAGTASYPRYFIKLDDGEILTGSSYEAGGNVSSENGYTVVTDVSWPYALEPGATKTLTLKSTKTASLSKVKEVAVTKRSGSNGADTCWTTVYGNNTQQPTTANNNPTTTKSQDPTQAPTTTKSQDPTQAPTTKAASTGNYPEWSANNVSYSLGNLVQYQGKVYECTYAHNSNSAWSPTQAPTLWKERPDLVAGQPEDPTSGNGGEDPTENNYTPNGTLPQHTVTGYWHNFSNGSTNLKLSDVPSYYDLICVAFTGNTSVAGEATFSVSDDLVKSIGYSDAQFKQDVKTLKNRGQHVIISVGGAEGRITIDSDAAASRFANSMINIIETYGFEGIDIDLEGMAVSGTAYIASALRTLHNHFGDDFIITMAPETYYMQVGTSGLTAAYWNLAISIKDILTTVHTQFYNTGGMPGYGGATANPGNGSFPANLSTLYIESGLRADQVAIGVPSNGPAASSGQITPAQAANAFTAMINGGNVDGFQVPKKYPTFRGLMTWSINWDATQNYAWAKAARAAVDGAPVIETSTTANNQPTEVTGLAVNSQNKGNVTFSWTQSSSQIASGQTYKVYIDGSFYKSYAAASTVTYTFTSNGSHTIKVTANLNGKETAGKTVTVNVTGIGQTETQTTKPNGNTNPTNGSLPSTVMIGYYHTWHSSGNPFIKLRDVDSDWDVINISFAVPVNPGSTDGKMKFEIPGISSISGYSISEFKSDIKTLQSQGKKVVLSIGGYEGYFSLGNDAAVNQFVSDIKGFVDEYGFDGIDIDLEQTSVNFAQGQDPDIRTIKSPNLKNMTTAIRNICSSYGKDFILSWAPETFYVQNGYMYYAGINQYCDARCGSYLPMINALRDITTFVHVQLYNSGPILGSDGQYYNMGDKASIVAMCKMLLDGFYVGAGAGVTKTDATWFAPLRPDQVVIGVPSSAGAAGSGQVSNSVLQSAFAELNSNYPGMRGIMTWSINWDNSQNNNSFVNENAEFLRQYRVEPETPVNKDAFSKIEAEAYDSNNGGVKDTNSNASGGYNMGGVTNGVSFTYNNVVFNGNANKLNICYSSKTSDASGNVEVYVDSNKVGTVTLANTGSNWSTYVNYTGDLDSQIAAGTHTVTLKFVTTSGKAYVANVDYFSFGYNQTTIPNGIEFNGYQISARAKGIRSVYSVEDTINGKTVVSSGLVYGVKSEINDSQMVVGSSSKWVASFTSTKTVGKLSAVVSTTKTGTSYAMTMLFATNTKAEFEDVYKVRAFAKLSDGSYVYSNIYEYSPYTVAVDLYKGCQMNSVEAHNYLYNDIIKVCNPSYKPVDYVWHGDIV